MFLSIYLDIYRVYAAAAHIFRIPEYPIGRRTALHRKSYCKIGK